MYPIGSVYISTSSTNPSTYFGGNWKRISQGRCLMGEGVVQANTDNWCGTTNPGDWTAYAGLQGGEVWHTLNINQIPSHNHPVRGQGRTTEITLGDSTWGWSNGIVPNSGNNAGTHIYASDVGGNQAHNNMPPYLVVYIWERTS